jgi:hypothetical protein
MGTGPVITPDVKSAYLECVDPEGNSVLLLWTVKKPAGKD